MKAGDPRSEAWVKRHLRGFERDDPITVDLLGLVGIEVTREQVALWTDTEVLLAEDYAAQAYLQASDHVVRVPALPAHLAGMG